MVKKKKKVSFEEKEKRRKMGRASRSKGHNFERLVAKELQILWPEARRQLEYHKDDANGVDIQNTGDFRFQCKKMKKYARINAIKEIQCEEFLGHIPVLVTAGDNEPPMAVLSFENLLDLIGVFLAKKI